MQHDTPTQRSDDPVPDESNTFRNAHLTVRGTPVPGNIVELEYESNAGGAWAAEGTTSIRGELLYIDTDSALDRTMFVMRDSEQGRAVSFPLDPDSVSQPTVRSLAAGRTRSGRAIGKLDAVAFTDTRVATFAPVVSALRTVTSGDTLVIDGEEYGVFQRHARGPKNRPYKFRATLVQPDGSEYVLDANPSYRDAPTFAVSGGSEQDLDPQHVSVGRLRERWDDHLHDETPQREETTDVFPAPHGAREGDRLTFAIDYAEGDGDSEQLAGVVTSVRYFPRMESSLFSSPEEKDPETRLDLDDGREAVLSNRRGTTHGMIIEPGDDAERDIDSQYRHGTVSFE